MANNCLVTKLKGAVDNDSLPEYGKVKIKINNGDVAYFYWGSTPGTMKVTGSLYFTNQAGDNLGKTMEISANLQAYRISSGEGYLVLPHRYGLVSYLDLSGLKSRGEFDIHELAYDGLWGDFITLGTGSSHVACFGDISDIAFGHTRLAFRSCAELTGSLSKSIRHLRENNMSMISLSIADSHVVLDMDDCQYMPELTELLLSDDSYGDFSKLGLTKVQTVYSTPKVANVLTGSVEDFVANKISVGLTSGTFAFQWANTYTKVTYTGQTLNSLAQSGVIPVGGATKLHWDEHGNITWTAS